MPETIDDQYNQALQLAQDGHYPEAVTLYEELVSTTHEPKLQTRVFNDLGGLAAVEGDLETARRRFEQALEVDRECHPARTNLSLIRSDPDFDQKSRPHRNTPAQRADTPKEPRQNRQTTKVAILSLLFNWPSTGGGIIHTAETGKFLSHAGYDVRHFSAEYPPWGIGELKDEPPVPVESLRFEPQEWHAVEIQRRFRQAVDAFAPDFVIITDSWNFKPLLAEAVQGYRYFLRLAALECLCPLNNVRMLFDEQGRFAQCPQHQLATPEVCAQCVLARSQISGSLHQAERQLAGYGSQEYDRRLRAAFRHAGAVLAVNPLIAEMVKPYAPAVRVVPSGFDPQRFPWPPPEPKPPNGKLRLLFAGLVEEAMKGFPVLREACRQLWEQRQDFELAITAEAPAATEPFERYIGWQSQETLPQQMHAADLLVFPTIAEEALGRSAVEAMGAGLPVVASRIGGLPFTVLDGATGLLFEPGDAGDLAEKITRLLDDPELRERMGQAGRRRFEEQYTWEQVIARHYRPLLGAPQRTT